ncbi:MAG: ATP synthase F1 subunit delta [Actinobacteria bacterium]|nr:MAG: ATP synthase F1 subunit delta [Actinomycetota bacterium]
MSDLVRGYAQALFQVAKAEGALGQVEDELFRFARILENESRLREALTDLELPPEHRAAMVTELLGDKASPHTINVIAFLVQQGRARELPKIIDSLVQLAAEERNKAIAEVRSAVPLDEERRRKLADAIERATGKHVEIKVLVDPTVIGGLLVRVGDQVFDGTVRRRLELAKEHIGRADNG